MRYLARHITALWGIVLTMMLGGCVNDYDTCGEVQRISGEVPVRFTLKLDSDGFGSRAEGDAGVWNPNYTQEIGTRFDSQVDRLHVMLIDAAGNLAHVELRDYMYVAEDGGYTFTGNIDFGEDSWEAGTYRVMLLANCGPAIMSAKTLDELPSTIDNVMWYNPDGSRREGVKIPMWGITTHNFTFSGKKDSPEEIGDISLLRAVAKVEIQLDKTKMDGYKLVSATISDANSYINPFPAGWQTATVTTGDNLRHGAPFNPVKTEVTCNAFTPGSFIDEAPQSIVFYLPEYDSAGKEATIDVTLNNEATGQTLNYTEALHFNDENVNDGAADGNERLATDIVRNHLYQFTIDGINFGTLTYSLACWEHVPSTIGWNVTGLDFEFTSTDNEAEYGYVSYPCYDDGKKIEYYYLNSKDKVTTETFKNYMLTDKATNAEYFFTLRSPKGAVWKAILVNADGTPYEGDHFEFAPGNLDSDNQRAVSTGIARDKAYSIAVRVSRGENNGNIWGVADEATYIQATSDDYPNLDLGSSIKIKEGTTDWYHSDDKKIVSKSDKNSDPYIAPVKRFALNENGQKAKDEGLVPEVYLTIRISLDGGYNFSEPLNINPEKPNKNFKKYKFAGDATKIQLRHLFIPFSGVANEELIKGNEGSLKETNTVWWGYPMGHASAPEETTE